MADAGAAKEMVEVKHIAAVLAPERGRAPVLNKDIAALTERMKKDGGKSVFQAEVAERDDDTIVNFDQMRRVLGDEKRRVDSEADAAKKAELQKRYDRLAMRTDIYDKLLNNEGYKTLTPEQKQDVVHIMASLPGFSEAVSLATGGRLTIEQVNKFLSGRGGSGVSLDERKAIGAIVEQFANSDKFHMRLAKSLSGLELPSEDATKASEIENRREKTKYKADRQKDKDDAEKTIAAIKAKYPGTNDLSQANDWYRRLNAELSGISETYKPMQMTTADVGSSITRLDRDIKDFEKRYSGISTPPAKGTVDIFEKQRTQYDKMVNSLSSLRYLEAELPDAAREQRYKDMKDYADSGAKKTTAESELATISQAEREMLQLEGERNKYADKFKRKMENALPDEMKRFWNDVVITQAVQAAEAEQAIKSEAEAAKKTEDQKREDSARALLDKYLKLSYLKYKGGKVVGWDDKAIKDFMHKDMLSQSPNQLVRSMLERVDDQSTAMPPEYQEEIRKLLTEMGVGKGTPPLTVDQALSKIPDSFYTGQAAQRVPDMLGYAWGRGYYFDRMKLRRGEAEFLRQAYPPEFFERAFEAKKVEIDVAQKMLNDHILAGDGTMRDKLRKIAGEDWTQGSKRLLKLTAVAGGIGAGVYGGLAFLGGGTAAAGVETLGGVVEAAKHTALAASTAATAGVRLASGAVTEAAFGVQESIADAATAAASAKAGVPVGRIPFPGVVRRP